MNSERPPLASNLAKTVALTDPLTRSAFKLIAIAGMSLVASACGFRSRAPSGADESAHAAPDRSQNAVDERAGVAQMWRDQDRSVHAHLDGYGWADRANGVVHIPIARAMNLIVAEQSSSGPPSDQPPAAEFQPSDNALRREGRQLFHQYGCSVCHEPDAVAHAPSLVGIHGQRVRLSNGTFVLADDRYLHDSILHASRQIVAGYTPRMPSYAGILPEPAVLKLIAYLKSFPDAARPGGPAATP